MHEYDTALKALLVGSANSVLEQIAGVRVARWLDVELPQVQQTRVDLLGESADDKRELLHVELQSSNDPQIRLRMAEYSLRVYRRFQRFPRQIVLYVGDAEMRMPAELAGPQHICRYLLLDVRTLDAETLLNSPLLADNVIAILTRLGDQKAGIRQILSRIATLESGARDLAFAQLLVLSGLRRLEQSIRTEVQFMPIMHDILDHEVIGPAIKQGMQQGRQEGRQEGEVSVLRRQIEKRFGSLPTWADEHLAQLSLAELDDLCLRVLDATSLDDVLPR
jgi:predicted transposase YdaD